VPVAGVGTPFHFTATREEQGYTWYSSDAVLDDTPLLEIGLRIEVPADGAHTVWLKFRGVTESFWSGRIGSRFWSGSDADYANPGAVVVHEMAAPNACFVFDSIDLARVCDTAACVHTSGDELNTLILQREELCGPDRRMVGVGGERGVLQDEANCVDPCGSPMVGQWMMYRHYSQTPVVNEPFSFVKGELDDEGYQWYNSTATETFGVNTYIVSRIAFKDDVQDGARVIRAKFAGHYRFNFPGDDTQYSREYWSSANSGIRGNPGSFIIKDMDNEYECYTMYEYDLDEFGVGTPTGAMTRLRLERVEM
jgi:hypothetical protein